MLNYNNQNLTDINIFLTFQIFLNFGDEYNILFKNNYILRYHEFIRMNYLLFYLNWTYSNIFSTMFIYTLGSKNLKLFSL